MRALIALCLVQAISGIAGGIGLAASPDGTALGFSLEVLRGTPFQDYLIPGVILLVVLGLFPVAVAWGLWRRRAWGWWAAGVLGIGLLIWLAVEVLLVGPELYGDAPGMTLGLWIGYGIVGTAIVVLALLPSARRYYRL